MIVLALSVVALAVMVYVNVRTQRRLVELAESHQELVQQLHEQHRQVQEEHREINKQVFQAVRNQANINKHATRLLDKARTTQDDMRELLDSPTLRKFMNRTRIG